MPAYDFRTLSPHDFEVLTRDLMQRFLKVPLETFSQGRDRGIDLRYSPATARSLIIQCKHYARSTYHALRRHLEHDEKPKIAALAPKRYILVTSCPLTPQRKAELYALLQPWIHSESDILGPDDLNNLLGLFPEIEHQQFKLWLTSIPILQRILHAGIFSRTQADLEHIRRRIALYAPTEAMKRARRLLHDSHYCIIAGVPGIGKTMLAEILSAELVEKDFAPVSVYRSIDDAWDLFDHSRKQVFLYDDFLGQTALSEKLGRNEDRSLLRFFDTVRANPNTRLILTTREYILKQAQLLYEPLAREASRQPLCLVTLEDYSRVDKARILSNHLYFGGVPAGHLATLLHERAYRRIVDHTNFSPRIVEMMTASAQQNAVTPADFLAQFLRVLDDPEYLWKHAYEHQLTPPARRLVQVRATLPRYVLLKDLKTAFRHVTGTPVVDLDMTFDTALRELDGSFLRSQSLRGNLVVLFANPSVEDFIKHRLQDDPDGAYFLLERAAFFEQVDSLGSIFSRGNIDDESYRKYWNRVRQVFNLPDCHLVLLGLQSDPNEVRASPLTMQSRLSVLVWRLRERDSDVGRSVLGEGLKTLTAALDATPTVDKSSLLDLLDALKTQLPDFDPDGEFLRAAKAAFLRGLDTLEDFEACFDLRRVLPEVLDADVDALRTAFSDVYEDDAYGYRSDVDDPESLRSYAEDLQRIGDWLAVDVTYQYEALQERAAEKDERRERELDFDDSGGWSRPATVRDETDDVFDALNSSPGAEPIGHR